MSDNKGTGSVVRQILVALVIALLVGGSAPWWWKELFPQYPSVPQSPIDTSTEFPTADISIQSPSEALRAPSPFADIPTTLVFGPHKGALDLVKSDNLWATEAASVELKDFVATATFQNPFSASQGFWTHAIFFRDQYGTEQYRLIISENQQWALSDSGNVNGIIQMGDVPNLRLGPDDSNTIWLYCQRDKGIFYLNGEYVADLDLSARQNSGDVRVGRFLQGDQGDGYSTSYQDFAVWEIR